MKTNDIGHTVGEELASTFNVQDKSKMNKYPFKLARKILKYCIFIHTCIFVW